MGEGGKAGKAGLENEFFKFQQMEKSCPRLTLGPGSHCSTPPAALGDLSGTFQPLFCVYQTHPPSTGCDRGSVPPKHPGMAHPGSHTPILLSPHPEGRALPGHGMCLLTPCSPGSRGERPESCRNSLVPGSEGEQTLETEKSMC